MSGPRDGDPLSEYDDRGVLRSAYPAVIREVVLPPPRRRSILRHAIGIVATCALVFVCAPFGGMAGLALAHMTSVDRVHESHLCTTTVYYPSESTWACTGGASLHIDGNSNWCQRP